jgi:hypothetical protein
MNPCGGRCARRGATLASHGPLPLCFAARRVVCVGMKTGRVPGTGTGYGYQNGTNFRIRKRVFYLAGRIRVLPGYWLPDTGRIRNHYYPVSTRKSRVGYGYYSGGYPVSGFSLGLLPIGCWAA